MAYPWFASTPIQHSGRAARTACTRSMSSLRSPVSFNFSDRACAYLRAPAAIVAGASAPSVKVVTSGRGTGTPASFQTAKPSGGLRAPTGRNRPRCARRRRQQFLQRGPIDALLDLRALRFDARHHGLRGIAQVVHAGGFAAAAMLAIIERHDDDLLFFEHESRDAKRRRQPQFLHLDAQLERGHQ